MSYCDMVEGKEHSGKRPAPWAWVMHQYQKDTKQKLMQVSSDSLESVDSVA